MRAQTELYIFFSGLSVVHYITRFIQMYASSYYFVMQVIQGDMSFNLPSEKTSNIKSSVHPSGPFHIESMGIRSNDLYFVRYLPDLRFKLVATLIIIISCEFDNNVYVF